MEKINFVEIPWEYGDEPPVEINGFINLGEFRDVDAGTARFDEKPGYYPITNDFLVIVDNKFFLISVVNSEDIFTFLKDKEWYSEKTTRLLFFQLYSMWLETYKHGLEQIDWSGIHPLEQNKAVKQIFNSLNELLNFKLENASANE